MLECSNWISFNCSNFQQSFYKRVSKRILCTPFIHFLQIFEQTVAINKILLHVYSNIDQSSEILSALAKISAVFNKLWDCSYGNIFRMVFPLNREEDIISTRSYAKYFSAQVRFILASSQVRKFRQKPIFKMGDINLKKNGSVCCI